MNLIIAFLIVFALIIVFRLGLDLYLFWRRWAATRPLKNEKILHEIDGVSIHILADKTVNSIVQEGRPIRSEGRLVVTDTRVLLASSQGRVLEISHEQPGSVKALGGRRLILLGRHPTGKARMRVELVIEEEKIWEDRINQLFIRLGIEPERF